LFEENTKVFEQKKYDSIEFIVNQSTRVLWDNYQNISSVSYSIIIVIITTVDYIFCNSTKSFHNSSWWMNFWAYYVKWWNRYMRKLL